MKKVLILDDQPEILDLWKEHFRLWKIDAEIITASNGQEGLNVFHREKNVDLIITDYVMPKMDGLEFIRTVRSSNYKVPVCFFTGYLPELTSLVDELDNVLLFEKPAFSDKFRIYIKICLQNESKPVEAI